MRRSGSTVIYQKTADLGERLGAGEARGWVEPRQFGAVLAASSGAVGFQVVKCHDWIPEAAALEARGRAIALYSFRDIRDVVVSMMNKSGEDFWPLVRRGFLQVSLKDYERWTALSNAFVSRYETITSDLGGEVRRIAAHLGLAIPDRLPGEFAEAYSLAAQIQRIERFDFDRHGVGSGRFVHDPHTLLHRNHIRSGRIAQWRDELSPMQVALLEDLTCAWLRARGYAISQGVAARKRARLGYLVKKALWFATEDGKTAAARSSPQS
jgi:hypothetical protein